MKDKKTGICYACGKRVNLGADGNVRKHLIAVRGFEKGSPCPGWGAPPMAGTTETEAQGV